MVPDDITRLPSIVSVPVVPPMVAGEKMPVTLVRNGAVTVPVPSEHAGEQGVVTDVRGQVAVDRGGAAELVDVDQRGEVARFGNVQAGIAADRQLCRW